MILLLTVFLAGQTVAEAPKTAAAEKRICKRAAETGSFVKGKKVCLTRREWDRASEKGQEQGREMQTLISTETGN